MTNQIQTAIGVKNSSHKRTLAHETRKNKLVTAMFFIAALAVAAAFTSCKDDEKTVASELVGKWEAEKMVLVNFGNEEVTFPHNPVYDYYPTSVGFEFTSSTFEAFTSGISYDKGSAHTDGNKVIVSKTKNEWKEFTWGLSGNTLTLTITIKEEWDGDFFDNKIIYTCKKVSKFSWE